MLAREHPQVRSNWFRIVVAWYLAKKMDTTCDEVISEIGASESKDHRFGVRKVSRSGNKRKKIKSQGQC